MIRFTSKDVCKYILLIVFFLPLCVLSQQQAEKHLLRGKIVDSLSARPLAYATITLLDNKQNIITSTYSNEQGLFTVECPGAGSFRVEITSVGYLPKEITALVSPGKKEITLDDIPLTTAAGSLQGVTVTSRKRLVEQRPGMLVYNAENDITNKGGTAADVLRKAPVLSVDAQGNVTMRGSSNIKILINGKYSGQMARSAADALNMMPADIIKSVEVVTTPSAKYDAEGAAGVINIITKKGRKNINGALELSGSNLEQMFNPRVAVTSDKWSFSLHGHLHRFRTKEKSMMQRDQLENGAVNSRLNQAQSKDNAAPHGSGDLAVVFTPDSTTEFSFGMNAWFGRWPDNRSLQTIVATPGGTIREQYSQQVRARESYLGSDINIGYNRKFRKTGQELTILGQVTPGKSKLPYTTTLKDIDDNIFYEERNDNRTNNREWTLQADYIQPLSAAGKYTIETGIKGIFRRVKNRYQVFATDQQGALTPDPLRSDDFRYNQDVYAAYVMGKANLANGWYAEGGLRLEETKLDGRFLETGARIDGRFTNLVPTATLSKKISYDQTLTLSYTQRLTRPYIWDLNPNANASDPKNIVVGNPDLQPETARQAELVYGWNRGDNFFLNTALFWKSTGHAIVDFIQADAGGVSTTSKQNLASNKVYGLNLSSTAGITPKVSMNGNVNISYLDYSSGAIQVLSKGWALDVDMNTTVKLPKRFSLQLFGEYNSRKVTLQGSQSFQYYYSVAVKKEVVKPRLMVTLALVNPFTSYISQTAIVKAAGFHSVTDNRYYLRSVKLTLNWEFGSMFGGKSIKKVNNDDVSGQPKG